MFLAYRQVMNGNARAFDPLFVIRTREDPAPYVATLRALVSEQDPSLALDSVMTMEDRVMTSLARPRTYAVLLGVFAVLAAAIAGVGLFGVLAYSVAQRTREIGVRTALGARPGDIAALVLRQAFVMTLGGLAAGMWVAFAVGRSLSKFLYGVTGHDTITFVAVPGVLIALAAIACVIPARRAARVDPLRALRS
jgi:ABC-type antimicrobial peptide transport system permease subunit